MNTMINDDELLEKNNSLKKVIGELANDTKLTDDKLTEYLTKFNDIYSNGFRHEYSEITMILFSLNNNNDTRDFMASKINDIYDKSRKLCKDCDTTKALKKLKDHINLENIRMIELIKLSKDINCANETAATLLDGFNKNQNTINNLNQEVADAEKSMKNIQKSMQNSTTESITILSIFAAIVITFSGGISFISNAISGINKVEPYRLSVFILLIGNIMFNIIFLLLYIIGKITNKHVCSESLPCFKNPCNKKIISCYIIKYPYIIWFNFIDISCIVISLYLSFIDRFNVFTRILNMEIYWMIFSCIFGLCLISLFIFIGYKIKNIKCSQENNLN